MRIVVIGGGPGGLYFSLLMKKANPSHEITVLERNPPDATFGWGVVFSEETLGSLRDADRPTFDEIADTFARWGAIDIKYRGETIRSRGHVFSAIARKRLLDILQRRCSELGVEPRFHAEVESSRVEGADLVIGADGVNSLVRREREEAFRPEQYVHSTKFAWFGTDLLFPSFTFVFRENEHGLFQVHGYPFDAHTSTFIVECPGDVWRRAGLDQATEEESIRFCEKLFAEDLQGHSLLSNRSIWISFVTLRNESWHDGNVALMGDAAHTAHFTIGSGTKLAMEDAISLVEALERRGGDVAAALVDYEMERQPVIERFQQAALESSRYFEGVTRYATFEPIQFAFNLLTRSGRITHLELEKRDAPFIAAVDAWFHGRGETGSIAPAPLFAPLRLRDLDVWNRVVLSPVGEDDAVAGVPGEEAVRHLEAAVRRGAGVVLTEFVAVAAQGRVTSGTPGLYMNEHRAAWASVADASRAVGPSRMAIRIGHAGARGATRPRREGVDRPLREGGWPLLAASAVPYTSRSPTPREMTREDMDEVVDDFVQAARMAAEAGFDLLEVDAAHGYLLSGFLSPLTNRRRDLYGGSLERRSRFPLEVVQAVRAAWPEERPLVVGLSATDWVLGGFDVDDAVMVAGWLKDRGCDLIHVYAGQTAIRARLEYGRLFLAPYSDRVRNQAGIPTMVGGNVTSRDEANTLLAAGRADLVIVTPPP